MSDVILTTDESIEVLKALGEYRIKDIRHNAVLMIAILKLNGQYPYPAYASGGIGEIATPDKELWILRGDKIPLIKAVRYLLDMGLKEAKEYVEGRTGMARPNNDVVVRGWTTSYRHNKNEVISELRGYNVHMYTELV
jgi:hypothetical protein